jgi:hypothetical protein
MHNKKAEGKEGRPTQIIIPIVVFASLPDSALALLLYLYLAFSSDTHGNNQTFITALGQRVRPRTGVGRAEGAAVT